MSAAEVAYNWQQDQTNAIATYKPKKPEMPNDYVCADCETPSLPPGTSVIVPEAARTESFQNYGLASLDHWLIVFSAVSVAFVLICLYKKI